MSFGDKLAAALKVIVDKANTSVEVGFLEGATYPDGTPVAEVAYFNEYGTTYAPPRPFFRTMIAKEQSSWGPKLAAAYEGTNGNMKQAFAIVGEDIEGALKQSINDLTSPALAPSTVKRKGFSKPLIDTGHMVNSTGYRVTGGGGGEEEPVEDAAEEGPLAEVAEGAEGLL